MKFMLPPPPPELTRETIHHSFGRLHAEQGERCMAAGGVRIDQVVPLNKTDLEISGQVHNPKGQPGARVRPFQTQVYYQPTDEWLLSGDCTCPAGGDCKHCAALVYAWLNFKPDSMASASQIEAWLEGLQEAEVLEKKVPPLLKKPQGHELLEQRVYLLHPEDSVITLEVGLQYRSSPDKPWRKWSPKRPLDLLQLGLPFAEQELLQLLASMERGSLDAVIRRIPLEGKRGALALEEMLATQRCYWQSPPSRNQDKCLQWGSPREVQAGWAKVPGGQQWQARLSPEAPSLAGSPRPPLFIVGTEVLYYDAEQHSLGPVQIEPEKLKLWLQAPVIPDHALEKVSRSLLKILPAPPLPSGLPWKEIRIEQAPIPYLLLTHSADPDDEQHLALLFFKYADQQVRFSQNAPQQASQLSEELQTIYQIQRDLIQERKAFQTLLKSGLLPLESPEHGLAFGQDDTYTVRNWHHWLNDSLPELRQAGWQIEIAPEFKLNFLSSPAWQAELTVQDQHENCFDLALGIEINGETVNLLPMLLRLLRTVPDLQAMREELSQHHVWLLPLDHDPMAVWAARSQQQTLPQRWLEVPARRLARILDILIELYDHIPQNSEPETIKLSYFSALQINTQALLNPDDYGVYWQAPAGLKAASEQLAAAQGPTIAPPESLQAQLRPYQQQGLNWLSQLRQLGLNGILADDMGLGKTLQTLALLLSEKVAGRLSAPALVVMPTSVLSTWEQEAQRFAPHLRVFRLYGPDRETSREKLSHNDVILTSYTLFRQDAALHQRTRYSWLILDEAQMIKNPRSQTALTACAQPAQHRLCLSGTPIENHLEELWSLFHFLMPGFLDTLERFNSRFRHPIERTNDRQRLKVLRERISPMILRRVKGQVAQELPPKTTIIRTVELGSAQRDLYETVRLAVDQEVRKAIADNGFKRSQILVLDALLKLRQVCVHPQLLKLPEAQKVRHSAKLELLMELVSELLYNGRRILIFSQFVSMLEIIEKRLKTAEIGYCKLTGRTRQRDAVIARFQQKEVPIFLISLKAGGVGLNLTAADTVIHYDPWWNPAAEQQASDRSWRIGQTQPVFVYKLIAAGTLEEQILALQESKKALSDDLLNPNAHTIDQLQILALLK